MVDDKHTKYASSHINFQCSDSQREQNEEAEGQREEKRREEENHDIYLYIRSLQDKQTEPFKIGVFLRIHSSVHEAAKIIAPFCHSTVSELYEEGVLKHLEVLAEKLPSTVQLNIVHQVQAKSDSVMLDLEVDLAREELLSVVNRVKKLKPTPDWNDPTRKRYLLNRLRKLLPGAIRLAKHSENEEFHSLVFEARELLRGASC